MSENCDSFGSEWHYQLLKVPTAAENTKKSTVEEEGMVVPFLCAML